MIPVVHRFALIGCFVFALFGPARVAAATAKYRGFTIDETAVVGQPDLEKIRAATREQIDLISEIGLPKDVMEFFQHVPFVLVPSGTIPRGSPGLYGGRDRSVKIVSSIVSIGHKPVLLHELLHAYHDQRLSGGVRNADVLKHYDAVKTTEAFAAKSHMLQNPGEFFACAATTFLFGVTGQEPFTREKLKSGAPQYFAYLQKLFGPATGAYAGSLTR